MPCPPSTRGNAIEPGRRTRSIRVTAPQAFTARSHELGYRFTFAVHGSNPEKARAMNEANYPDQGSVATSAHPSAPSPAWSTYRELISRGLEANEAANLTAFINGLAVVGQPWKINELNHVLFLRELYRLGRFGSADGAER
jgi:hypothetical protein